MARVLIVEDDESTAKFIQTLLEKNAHKYYDSDWNMRFDHAEDAIKAMELMKVRNYEMIITDIMMAKMSGWEFVKYVRADKDRSELPLLVVTAVDGVDIKYESVRNGATDGFAKPLRGEEAKRFVSTFFNLVMER